MRSFRDFLRAKGGNVAVMFGLLSVPVIGLAGAAIDYSTAARDQSRLQTALDAGALAGAKLLGVRTNAEALAEAESIIRNNLPTALRTVPLNYTVTNNNTGLRVTTATTRPTSILNIVGVSSFSIAADSTAVAPASRKLEIVLALDNTGSMGQLSKLVELKAAVINFLNIMQTSGRPVGDVRIGIVPFATQVRPGATYWSASWLSNSYWFWWDGCVTDRNQPYNTDDTPPTSSQTRFQAAMCASNVATLQPLTTDFVALRATVASMVADGNTNVTIGVEWAWHLISPNEPFTQGAGPNANTDRWIIVLTDGDNTQDRYSTSASAIDVRTQRACDNVKADGIRVMTVRVIEGNRDLLSACASDASNYYEVSQANQLTAVFQQIAGTINGLRLSQ